MDNHTTIHDLKIEPWIIYDLQIVSLSNVGETRSNVCFKDNSHNGNVFPIQKTIVLPIIRRKAPGKTLVVKVRCI